MSSRKQVHPQWEYMPPPICRIGQKGVRGLQRAHRLRRDRYWDASRSKIIAEEVPLWKADLPACSNFGPDREDPRRSAADRRSSSQPSTRGAAFGRNALVLEGLTCIHISVTWIALFDPRPVSSSMAASQNVAITLA
jgi:hypothetical protein